MNALIRGDRARQAVLLAVACVASITSGCSLVDRRPKVPIDSAAGLYDSAKIEYKLDAGQLNLPLAVTRVEGQLVSYDQVPSDPRRDASVGTLKIEYPHPEGRPGMARARLEISSTSPHVSSAAIVKSESTTTWGKVTSTLNPKRRWTASTTKSQKVDETWEFDIPRSYLDSAVTSLNRAGYFDTREKGTEGVEIAAKVDGKQVIKSWRQVPEFNELMLAVRNQGRLVAYTRPSGDAASADQSARLANYERYAEQDRVASLATTDAAPSWQPPAAANIAGSAYPPAAPSVVPYFPETAQPSPPLPRQDSAPWRVGSRPAPALPPAQAPGSYPSTGFGSSPPASPNVAAQPQWQGAPY